ncbi:hypothetical protein ETE53_22640 [Escherichia coli]|nr:hypothetical protein ETE53_22640 [Escherichia coli]
MAPDTTTGRDPPQRREARFANRASGFGGDWRVRQQLPVGVGPDDRMPPGSREPKVRPADRTTLQ